MTDESILNQLIDNIIEMEIEKAKEDCREALTRGISPITIVQEGVVKAMQIVGDKFENEEYYLPELIMAGETMEQIMNILKPYIEEVPKKDHGKIVIGTGKGDMHDIGKNIVKTFLNAEGFEVIDLGVDVTSEQFIEAIKKEDPIILAVSALITSTMPEVGKLMKLLKEAQLRDKLKIIIGGAPITQKFVDDIGADAYGKNAIDGVKKCLRWIER